MMQTRAKPLLVWRSCRGARHRLHCKTPPPVILHARQLLAALGFPASPTMRFHQMEGNLRGYEWKWKWKWE